ncbi:MAG TPA: prolyl oligopeptidase family serine peptidase, partial [Thermoleophilia bacterium]|nr:prolyl oligopeptidase family serine peptidase [Thermoleophilia bacterium]
WSPAGDLWFASDRTGWWNLYAVTPDGGSDTEATRERQLVDLPAEFANAPRVFGLQHFVFLADRTLAVSYTQDGRDHLAVVDAPAPAATAPGRAAALRELGAPFTVVYSLAPLGDRVALIAASHIEGLQVAVIDPRSGTCHVVRRGRPIPLDPDYVSRPEPIVFPTAGGLSAHANYYPPTNPGFAGPAEERPPLFAISHGGPTSANEAKLDLDIQYWTSRGIAVVDVNYGGSTGYGREYRERLRGAWGIVDTVDCVNAARFLVERGDADPERVAIRGGSAGGYTTLNALTRFDFFSAGGSLFGLADLETFATGGTHKFESRYLDSLLGPYPEMREVYRERSPIDHVDDLSSPVILLQGLEDVIVPPAQAEIIVEALRRKGLPFAYLAFEGEQHGFRKAENIIRAQEAELYFYGRVFGFDPADEIEPVEIENLD